MSSAWRAAVARQWLLPREWKPELIISDIQLADGSSGIDVVNDIVTSGSKPVIFITAYPAQYLSTIVNRPEPAFILSKPFNPNSVRAAVSRALFFDRRAHAA